VFGVRPGNPFLFTIAATGERPVLFSAENLPPGLRLDLDTGRIAGKLDEPGTYRVLLRAKNGRGQAERELRIVAGERLALTPPMGANTWNCWGPEIDDTIIRRMADAFVTSGLINHGWAYVNIDDGWAGERAGELNALSGNEKFPDMKALADYVHSLGLKLGVYSTAFKLTYAGTVGGSSDDPTGKRDPSLKRGDGRSVGKYVFAYNDARQFARWGIDYLKYDWWIADVERARQMADALRVCGRDIVYSICNGASLTWTGAERHADKLSRIGNLWRTGVDITDTWDSVLESGFTQEKWANLAGPGHWNDPDMLVVGKVGWGVKHHPTRLTPDEQYSHISMWCLLSAPLLIGCDLTDMDAFTLGLLTNDEVLELDQDPLGDQSRLINRGGDSYLCEVWVKDMEDGSKAVGLFNLNGRPAEVGVNWADARLQGPQVVRDLWRQKDLGFLRGSSRPRFPGTGSFC
jgi:alpha-galactosidase